MNDNYLGINLKESDEKIFMSSFLAAIFIY